MVGSDKDCIYAHLFEFILLLPYVSSLSTSDLPSETMAECLLHTKLMEVYTTRSYSVIPLAVFLTFIF
jgi:hypothetical protein